MNEKMLNTKKELSQMMRLTSLEGKRRSLETLKDRYFQFTKRKPYFLQAQLLIILLEAFFRALYIHKEVR